MKQSNGLAITRIVLLAIIACILLGIMILLLTKNFRFSNMFETNTKVIYNDKFNVLEVKDLVVSARNADVQIEESTGTEIEIAVHGKKEEEVSVTLENNILKVERDAFKNFCIGFCFDSSEIIIKVPNTYKDHFQIKTISGDINIDNFKDTNMNVSTTSGDINIMSGNELKVSTVSGEMTIESGNSLKGSTTSGDIEITSLKNICEIETVSGYIEIGVLNLIKNSTIKTVSGDVEIDHLNDVYVDTETLSGDVSVANNNRQAQLELKIKTTSGNIEVGNR